MGLGSTPLLLQTVPLFTSLLFGVFIGLLVLILLVASSKCSTKESSVKSRPVIKSGDIGKPVQLIDEMPRQHRKDSPPFATASRTTTQAKRPISGVASSLSESSIERPLQDTGARVARGGEFIGNRMRFKVKLMNESQFTITDVRIFLLSYPHESLKLMGDDDKFFSKIEPNGFRSPTFDFLPTQDCVRGNIIAGVSFVDMRGQPHTITAKPFVIRSVCDLLIPEQMSPDDFTLRLKRLEHGEVNIKVNEWTPEEMFEKVIKIMDDSNFFEVDSKLDNSDGIVFGHVRGSAKGKYTGKSVAVEITVTGPSGERGASSTIKVSGEDQAMILPAIDDLKERLSAWLCPLCGSPLTLDNVEDLKSGKSVCCPFCRVSISR